MKKHSRTHTHTIGAGSASAVCDMAGLLQFSFLDNSLHCACANSWLCVSRAHLMRAGPVSRSRATAQLPQRKMLSHPGTPRGFLTGNGRGRAVAVQVKVQVHVYLSAHLACIEKRHPRRGFL